MRKGIFSALLIFLLGLAPGISSAFEIDHADNVPTHLNKFVGPELSTQISTDIHQNKIMLFHVEGGPRIYRASTTAGWRLGSHQQNGIKITGEFLTQQLDFDFFAGAHREWVRQFAGGIAYAYVPDSWPYRFLSEVDFSAWTSYAPKVSLSTIVDSFVNGVGDTINFKNKRRIAGSNAFGFTGGFVVHPWPSLAAHLLANFDHVVYHTQNIAQQSSIGMGGTIKLVQTIARQYFLTVGAAFREPFNSYQASIAHAFYIHSGQLILRIFGNYVQGHRGLPESDTLGVRLDYVRAILHLRPGHLPSPAASPESDTLTQWLLHPAVEMATVLVIPDQMLSNSVTTGCVAPTFAGPILDTGIPAVYDASVFFSGTAPLTFSRTIITPGLGIITINPATGIVTVAPGGIGVSTRYTVTATNACGNVTSNDILAT